ncbi:hypothetical protein SGHV128 [Glossina pallidipes salivary gland hypertrophy virus]|uniref:Uncharacterized protein n=1 Tax=Glossina hytrovirus (isolate Glossina pallidipes/Ethiopia/Seibersdorf/-) TaxID=379529 RepID=B0YLT2_GHVS|nr:hypothetical protein SGHV128 [Glossina pallidipes salivary gland hypertrophy virus]ABQ08901.1 hypothetical protein SGHV128 [Glossina pallidipes salivary gland hypertrophy virus]
MSIKYTDDICAMGLLQIRVLNLTGKKIENYNNYKNNIIITKEPYLESAKSSPSKHHLLFYPIDLKNLNHQLAID